MKAYETLVKEFPNSIYKKDAEERIDVLNGQVGRNFTPGSPNTNARKSP